MSDLQSALLVIGAAIIVGVIAYNKWQERTFRRLADHKFEIEKSREVLAEPGVQEVKTEAPDVLDVRVEPVLHIQSAVSDGLQGEAEVKSDKAPKYDVDSASSPIDWCAVIEFHEVTPARRLIELAAKSLTGITKTVQLEGLASTVSEWRPLAHADEVLFLRASVQLCDRRGAISEGEFARYLRALTDLAGQSGGSLLHESPEAGLQRARELDGFCSDTDVQIGVNVVAIAGQIDGSSIVRSAESIGGVLREDGSYHFPSTSGVADFRMSNLESARFSADAMHALRTAAVTFEIDIPRSKGGPDLVDEVFALATAFARSIGGRVVDDNRRELTDASLASIRAVLAGIHARMIAREIAPGEDLALRLYS
jgi:FtsZ-interacting cell division protein ZipA